jgi:hypothetical protein
MILRRQERRRSTRWATGHTNFVVPLRTPQVNVHEKADRHSKVVAVTPPQMKQISVSALVPGLREGGERFWQAACFEEGVLLNGFIHDSDVDLSLEIEASAEPSQSVGVGQGEFEVRQWPESEIRNSPTREAGETP